MNGRIIKLALTGMATTLPELVMAAAEPVEKVSMSGYAIKLTMSMLLILALMAGLAWFVKRYGLGNIAQRGTGNLNIVASTSLGSRERIVIVQTGPDQVVLGITPGSIETLHVLKDIQAEESPGSKFQKALKESQSEENKA